LGGFERKDMAKKLLYMLVGSKARNRTVFNVVTSGYPGEWHFVRVPEDLNLEFLHKIKPA
jgi:hypothetical protein